MIFDAKTTLLMFPKMVRRINDKYPPTSDFCPEIKVVGVEQDPDVVKQTKTSVQNLLPKGSKKELNFIADAFSKVVSKVEEEKMEYVPGESTEEMPVQKQRCNP